MCFLKSHFPELISYDLHINVRKMKENLQPSHSSYVARRLQSECCVYITHVSDTDTCITLDRHVPNNVEPCWILKRNTKLGAGIISALNKI